MSCRWACLPVLVIYGVVALAHEYGYGFAYYLGVAGTFILAPLLSLPLLRIVRASLHSSLADVLTRYRTQWAGSLITLFMLLAVWPLLALQIQAVAESIHILTIMDADDNVPLAEMHT